MEVPMGIVQYTQKGIAQNSQALPLTEDLNGWSIANTMRALPKLEVHDPDLMEKLCTLPWAVAEDLNRQSLAKTMWALAKLEVRPARGKATDARFRSPDHLKWKDLLSPTFRQLQHCRHRHTF